MKHIDRKYLEKAMDYPTYRQMIDDLLQQGKTTGTNQSESLTEYAKLNVTRMKRIDKTIQILPETKEVIEAIDSPQTWIVITEGWCGDAAQIVPVLFGMSKLNKQIDLKLVLRDENLELMDQYLTNGKSRSIPRLIVTRSEDLAELFNWGARPQELQHQFDELKANNLAYPQIAEKLHAWYANDKTQSTQREITALLKANR